MVVGLILMLWTVCMLPTSFFEMAVGYSFGFHRALMITWVAKSIGGVLSFMLGRTLLRSAMRTQMVLGFLGARCGLGTPSDCAPHSFTPEPVPNTIRHADKESLGVSE